MDVNIEKLLKLKNEYLEQAEVIDRMLDAYDPIDVEKTKEQIKSLT